MNNWQNYYFLVWLTCHCMRLPLGHKYTIPFSFFIPMQHGAVKYRHLFFSQIVISWNNFILCEKMLFELYAFYQAHLYYWSAYLRTSMALWHLLSPSSSSSSSLLKNNSQNWLAESAKDCLPDVSSFHDPISQVKVLG